MLLPIWFTLPTLPAWLALPALPVWLALMHMPLLLYTQRITKKQAYYAIAGMLSLAFGILYIPTTLNNFGWLTEPITYPNALGVLTSTDNLFCFPEDPAARTLRAPKIPKLCYDTNLPQPFLDLACDFEAHEYCHGVGCDFWFEAVMQFSQTQAIASPNAPANPSVDPEVTIRMVNHSLDKAHTKFLASLDLLHGSTARTGKLDHYGEKEVLAIAFHVIIVLMWHCDESRTRPMKSKYQWSKTYDYLIEMEKKLREHGAGVQCWPPSLFPPLSPHCYEIEEILANFKMLLPEFRRRLVWRVSQCPGAKGEL
ncbi:Nn.00g007350.m01.CDS01 [Neocucurbitaria sp. VM-36]